MKRKAKWTFMVYMAGDNSLSSAGEKDLDEMRTVGSSQEVNVVAEFDRVGPGRETQRYQIQKDGCGERSKSIGETDCGDPNVLVDFVSWAAGRWPAERYALVLWNHGGGWEPAAMDVVAQEVKARSWGKAESTERGAGPLGRAFFRTTLQRVFSMDVEARAICSDDGSGHSLDTIELGKVLERVAAILGQPLDLLGMDACLMSNLEVAYQSRPYVRYIVASEESEPNDGWPYDRVLRQLVDRPEQATADLAGHIVQAYVQSYVDRGYSGPVTQSALDLSQLDVLTGPLDALADAMRQNLPTIRYKIGDALYSTKGKFWHSTLWDLAEFCQELAARSGCEEVRQAAEAVQAALQPQGTLFVIAEAHSGTKVARCGGTTIYLPPPVLCEPSAYYAELAYAKEHRWDEMLAAYHAA